MLENDLFLYCAHTSRESQQELRDSLFNVLTIKKIETTDLLIGSETITDL